MKFTKGHVKVSRGIAAIFAGVLTLSAGAVSVVQSYRGWIDSYLGTVSSGIVIDETDENVDLYNYRVRGEFEVDGKKFNTATTQGMVEYSRYIGTKLSEEGITLMKNDNGLPLAKNSTVTLLGRRAYNVLYGGAMGSTAGPASECKSFVDALKEQGFTVDSEVADKYIAKDTEMTTAKQSIDSLPRAFGAVTKTSGYALNEISPSDVGLTDKGSKSGVAIVVVGRPGSEAGYYLPGAKGKANDAWDEDHDCLGLSKKELESIAYAKKNYEKVIVMVNADSAMDLPELFEEGGDYEANSVVWVGLGGSYGWIAASRVLDGTVNPSGALPDLYATKSAVSAANQNYDLFYFQQYADFGTKTLTEEDKAVVNNEKAAWYMPEPEGIYVGYRYYETRYFDAVNGEGEASTAHKGANQDTALSTATSWVYKDEVVAGYGYGLSYTTFSETLKDVKVDKSAKTIEATVEVKNTGKISGKHTVQLYVNVPYINGGLEKSAIQLVGYTKTGILKENETETVTIKAEFQDIASYDSNLEHDGVKGGYILTGGDYNFTVGNGAHEAVNNVLAKTGKTVSNGMDAAGNGANVKTINIAETKLTESKNGTTIKNQLQDMELKSFEKESANGTITELSRSNWNSTWPKTLSNLKYTSEMEAGLRCKVYTSTENNNDGVAVKWDSGTNYKFADFKPEKGEWIDYDDERLIALVEQVKLEEAVTVALSAGGQDWNEIASIQQPTIKTVDGPSGFDGDAGKLNQTWNTANAEYKTAEGDTYADIQMRPLPTACVTGATFNHELVEEAGEMIGQIAIWAGVAEQWGPGVNLHRTPYNSRNHEYYSEDPVHLGWMADDYCRGAQRYGLVLCQKHFAFNDTDMNRSGLAPFMSEQRARELELRGFQRAFESGTALAVMGGFNRAGAQFCSAHVGLNRGILRGEWGFKGLAVTDMVNPAYYMNPRDSIMGAGAAALTGSPDANFTNGVNGWTEFMTDNIKKDVKLQAAVQEVVHNALYVFLNSNATNGLNGNSHLVHFRTWYDNLITGLIAGSATVTALAAAWYVLASIKTKDLEA